MKPARLGRIPERAPAMTHPITTAQFLKAYSRGEIGPEVAIRGIGASGFRDLLLAMVRHDLPLPRGRGREAATCREVEEALPILRAALRDPVPEP